MSVFLTFLKIIHNLTLFILFSCTFIQAEPFKNIVKKQMITCSVNNLVSSLDHHRYLYLTTDQEKKTFVVKTARDPKSRAQGFMGQEKILDNEGILFLFSTPNYQCFWMHQTRVSLDILFLDESGEIVDMHSRMIPYSTNRICSKVKAIAALEIAGGSIDKYYVKIGHRVEHPMLKRSK